MVVAQRLPAGIDTHGDLTSDSNSRNSSLLDLVSVRISVRNISTFIMSALNVHRSAPLLMSLMKSFTSIVFYFFPRSFRFVDQMSVFTQSKNGRKLWTVLQIINNVLAAFDFYHLFFRWIELLISRKFSLLV